MAELSISEQSIIEALTQCKGSVPDAARVLRMPLSRLAPRVAKSEGALNLKRAFRAVVFDELSEFTEMAVRDGVVKQIAVDPWGNLIKEPDGSQKFLYQPVDPTTRLAAAGKLMSMIKGEAGISDKTDHTIRADGSEEVREIAATLRKGLLIE